MATDGILSYAIFTYLCGGLNWLRYNYASIGFSITQNFFANHELSLTPNVNDIACANDSVSGWSNVVYQVSKQCNYVCGEGEAPHSSCDGSCIIVDICVATSPCQNGGTCVTIRGTSYYCFCPSSYVGFDCEGIGFYIMDNHINKCCFYFRNCWLWIRI